MRRECIHLFQTKFIQMFAIIKIVIFFPFFLSPLSVD